MSKRCSAKNRSGKRCGAWAMTGATKCALHADPERAAELGSKSGRRVKFSSLACALPRIQRHSRQPHNTPTPAPFGCQARRVRRVHQHIAKDT
jgi:hypothetical protein